MKYLIFLLLIAGQASAQFEIAPAPKFERVETIRGIVGFISKVDRGRLQHVPGIKMDSVFTEYYLSVPLENTDLVGREPSIEERVSRKTFLVKTCFGRVLRLDGFYSFVPESMFQ